MPALNGLLMVLKDDLDEVTEGGIDDIGSKSDGVILGRGICRWLVLNDVVLENFVCNAKVFSKFQWSFGVNMRDAIDCVAELAVGFASRVHNSDGAGDVDLSVVVGTLGIRPGSAGGEVPSE